MFGSLSKKSNIHVEPGSEWWLRKDYSNPFSARKPIVSVQIIEVRRGWVNYRMLPGGRLFQDESMELGLFLKVYGPAPVRSVEPVDKCEALTGEVITDNYPRGLVIKCSSAYDEAGIPAWVPVWAYRTIVWIRNVIA